VSQGDYKDKYMKKNKITILFIVAVFTTLYFSECLAKDNQDNRDEFKIYFLGASTAEGFPYFLGDSTIGSLISYFFNGEIKGRKIKIKFVKERCASNIVKEAIKIKDEADLVLIYSGHNEFLRYLPNPFCNSKEEAVYYPNFEKKKELVLKEYENAIEKGVIHFKNNHTPIILSSVVANISDFVPSRSMLINPDNRYVVDSLMGFAEKSFNSNNISDALSIYKKIITIEPKFALAYMKAADCFRLLGDFRNAKIFYQKASDYDGSPIRAMEKQNQYLRKLAEKENIYFLDAVKILEDISEDGLIGYNLMWDNCHPRLKAYIAIAFGFVKQIENIFEIERYRKSATVEDVKDFFYIGLKSELEILETTGSYYCRAALLTEDSNCRDNRLTKAEVCFNTALEINPDNSQLLGSIAIYHALRKDKIKSIIFWLKAFNKDPKEVKKRIRNRKVKTIMEGVGIKNLLVLLEKCN